MLSRHACSSPRFIFSKRPRLLDKISRLIPKHSLIPLRCNHATLVVSTTGLWAVDLTNNAPHSDLGLRSHRPPDSLPDPRQETPPEVSDQEWEIRTGGRVLLIGHLT